MLIKLKSHNASHRFELQGCSEITFVAKIQNIGKQDKYNFRTEYKYAAAWC